MVRPIHAQQLIIYPLVWLTHLCRWARLLVHLVCVRDAKSRGWLISMAQADSALLAMQESFQTLESSLEQLRQLIRQGP